MYRLWDSTLELLPLSTEKVQGIIESLIFSSWSYTVKPRVQKGNFYIWGCVIKAVIDHVWKGLVKLVEDSIEKGLEMHSRWLAMSGI